MSYKYITSNNLYEKQNYMYSEYGGISFLKDYINSRKTYLGNTAEIVREDDSVYGITPECNGASEGELNNIAKQHNIGQELKIILKKLKEDCINPETIDFVNSYTKSFEVRKRIYTEYDMNFKPTNDAGFEQYESYLLFAECLLYTYRKTHCLKYFNCLLKVDDTLLSVCDRLDNQLKDYLCRIICQELDCFSELANENNICMEV